MICVVIASGLPQPVSWVAFIARTAWIHHLLRPPVTAPPHLPLGTQNEVPVTAYIRLSTNHERLSQPVMKIGYWLHYFFYFSSCLTIVLGRIKFDCTLEDLHPVCQRKCFALEHSILSHLLWLARVAKSVLSRANLLPILW